MTNTENQSNKQDQNALILYEVNTERGQNIKAATDLVDTAVGYAGGRDSRPKNKAFKGFGR